MKEFQDDRHFILTVLMFEIVKRIFIERSLKDRRGSGATYVNKLNIFLLKNTVKIPKDLNYHLVINT